MEQASEITFETLRGLGAGESSTIVGVNAAQVSAKRMADMGFVSGARIEMVRPGNPCLVRIGGTCVGLGAANQNCILVANRMTSIDGDQSLEVRCPLGQKRPAPG